MTSIGHSSSASSPAAGVLTAERGGEILEVKNLSAGYGPYRALFDVSFSIPAGAVVALIGSNGAGKSTVARTITGLVTATEGSVTLAGTDVTKLSAWRIARLGVAHVVEGRGVFSSLSVEENLVLVFRQRAGRRSVAANLARAYEAFPILGERRKQVAGTLSGGQQRLLSLAKVLVVPPKLLVADELSLGLAPVVVDTVYEGLEAINRNGTAMLVVEQQVDRVLRLASKALVLDRGRVAYDGTPAGAATAIDQLLSRREEAGARAAALVDTTGGAESAPQVADMVEDEMGGAGSGLEDCPSSEGAPSPES
ncbi:MAG: ABC transporter ATP-binding protein [Acidimicrobiales bacterium]